MRKTYVVTKIINSEEPTISFSLPCRDWCLLEQSKLWERLDRYLEACQNTDIQMNQQERIKILETEVVRLFNSILMKKGGEKVKKNKKHLDKTIKLTCRKLQNENMIPEVYTKTLKALAKLVKARASLD